MVQPLWKTVWSLLTKLDIFLPYDSVIKLLGIYQRNQKLICTQMFSAILFIIAQIWKPPRYSVGEWINKLRYKTMKYYLVLKRTELSNHEKTWGKLKCIL